MPNMAAEQPATAQLPPQESSADGSAGTSAGDMLIGRRRAAGERGAIPEDESALEKRVFEQTVFQPEDLKSMSQELRLAHEAGDFVEEAKMLANLKRAGVGIKKENREKIYATLADPRVREKYQEQPQELVRYLTYMKYLLGKEQFQLAEREKLILEQGIRDVAMSETSEAPGAMTRYVMLVSYLGVTERLNNPYVQEKIAREDAQVMEAYRQRPNRARGLRAAVHFERRHVQEQFMGRELEAAKRDQIAEVVAGGLTSSEKEGRWSSYARFLLSARRLFGKAEAGGKYARFFEPLSTELKSRLRGWLQERKTNAVQQDNLDPYVTTVADAAALEKSDREIGHELGITEQEHFSEDEAVRLLQEEPTETQAADETVMQAAETVIIPLPEAEPEKTAAPSLAEMRQELNNIDSRLAGGAVSATERAELEMRRRGLVESVRQRFARRGERQMPPAPAVPEQPEPEKTGVLEVTAPAAEVISEQVEATKVQPEPAVDDTLMKAVRETAEETRQSLPLTKRVVKKWVKSYAEEQRQLQQEKPKKRKPLIRRLKKQ